jgi:5-formyltetrahydrofolate cyclo-ligase
MKKALRKKYLSTREEISNKKVSEFSDIIIKKLLDSKEYINAKEIFTYININNEVITTKFIDLALLNKKRIAVPKVLKNGIMEFYYIKSFEEVKKGKFNIYEPDKVNKLAKPSKKSLFIVPGILYDKSNNRVGYGGGYYDRYFNKYGKDFIKIGLAYNDQIIESIPFEKTDVKMDIVLTEK